MKKNTARSTSKTTRGRAPAVGARKPPAGNAKKPAVSAKKPLASRAKKPAVSAKKAPVVRAAPKPADIRQGAGSKTSSKASAGPPVPKLGAPAPPFTLSSDAGDNISPSDYGGKWLVLYFYPKDHTPGCTREALEFESAAGALADEGAVVVGVSRDSIATHCSFKAKQALHFPLLSDPSGQVHKLYGAYGQKMMYGKSITGALRTTALIRPDGTLAKLFQNVKVDGHADRVLAAIREEQALGAPKRG